MLLRSSASTRFAVKLSSSKFFCLKNVILNYMQFKLYTLETRGVVTVTVRLDELDITQCPGPVTQANAFKGTDRCDYRTTYCVPVLGRRWDTGGYKCECRQGYEYAFNDPITYCDGQIMEAEWEKKTKGLPNKFDSCRCRLAGASDVASSWRLISLALGALLYYCYYGPSTAVS